MASGEEYTPGSQRRRRERAQRNRQEALQRRRETEQRQRERAERNRQAALQRRRENEQRQHQRERAERNREAALQRRRENEQRQQQVQLVVILVTVLCLLNLVNPQLPDLRCEVGQGVKEPSISHQYLGDTVTTSKLVLAVILVPFVQMIITEWFCNKENPYTINANESSRWKRTLLRSCRWFRDYIYGLAVILLLNDIAKTTLNSPRPHWLDSCKPNFTKESCHLGWLSDYECTNTEISRWRLADARKSFPSGHSALSFYTAFFMGIYQHRRVSKRVVGTLFLLWLHILWFGYAIFCSLSRVADKRHHPVDVAFGGLLGAIGGLCSAVVLCKGFGKPINLASYQSKVVNGANGTATILDGFPNSPTNNVPLGMNGTRPINNDKRPSLRRLLSTQSTVTQMSDIVEDRELDSL